MTRFDMTTARLYRSMARELGRSNKDVKVNVRRLFESLQVHDVENVVTFLRSQRAYKTLLERYNPLIDLTGEERIAATARRVGMITTQVMRCDPASIQFDVDGLVRSSSPHTLATLRAATRQLVALQPVAVPTETVYGLAALALNTDAVSRIFSTKNRPSDNPLIVHVSSHSMLNALLPPNFTIPHSYHTLMHAFWPGPLTLLFPSDPSKISSLVTANHPTVAIRMPSHPVARALITLAGAPLAAPSANSSGKPSPTRAEHVFRDLNSKVSLILDGGPCDVGLESTVIDGLHSDGNIRILRPGGVTVEQIEEALSLAHPLHSIPSVLVHRRDFFDHTIENSPTTPGMKYRHYAPAVPLTLLRTSEHPPAGETAMTIPMLLASLDTTPPPKVGLLAPSESILAKTLVQDSAIHWHRYTLGSLSDLAIIAQRLFDGLLTLEREGVTLIFIEELPEENEGLAIMNRIKKAASETCWIIPHSL